MQRQLTYALLAGQCDETQAVQLSTMKAILLEQARIPQ